MTDLPQPRSEDAEEAILSCLIQFPTLCDDARKDVPTDSFYHAANRLLFSELLVMHERGDPIELMALTQHLINRSLLDSVGGAAVVTHIFNINVLPSSYGFYKKELKDKLLLRQMIHVCESSALKCRMHQDDAPEAVAAMCSQIMDTVKPELSADHKPFKTHIGEYLDIWQARMSGEMETAIPTRWDSFNATFGGITPTMWLICAYPSQGKSTLAQNLLEDAVAHGHHAIWYSFEMDRDECMDRLIVAQSKIDSKKVFFPKNNPINQEDSRAIARATEEMNRWNIHLRPEPSWTIEQIDADVRSLCSRHKVGLVVIDYLQLVPTEKDFGSRAEQVAYISRLVKRRISGANRLPVILLSQLNDDGRVLDSRAPTQDASNIISIDEQKGLQVGKNRNGKKGHHLPIYLNGSQFTFEQKTK